MDACGKKRPGKLNPTLGPNEGHRVKKKNKPLFRELVWSPLVPTQPRELYLNAWRYVHYSVRSTC